MGWAPNNFVLGAQFAPSEKELACFLDLLVTLQNSKAGGGSGGNIYIETRDFTLTGRLYCNGGSSTGTGGGGSGGRVTVYFSNGDYHSGYVQAKGNTVKPVLSGHSKRTSKLVFKTDYRLMKVQSIAECSKGSILQYFRPSLSYHLSLIFCFCLFLSGGLREYR